MPQLSRILKDEMWASTSLQLMKALHRTWNKIGGRLLAWIGDQVRLKAFSGQERPLYIRRGAALC